MFHRNLSFLIGSMLVSQAVAAQTSTPAANQAVTEKFPVHAYVVSVSTYRSKQDKPDEYRWRQPMFTEYGQKVADYLEGLYGKEDVTCIFDGDATRNRLLQELDQNMPNFAPGTLVIFYFIGHGLPCPPTNAVRASASWPITTLLALHGADPTDQDGLNYDRSISIDELITAFANADQCNFMIFLDCCHAGVTSIVARAPDRYNHDLFFRGFALVSSSADNKSSRCHFTQALLDIWPKPSTDINRTAEQILDDVNASISNMPDKPQTEVPGIEIGNPAAKMGQLSRGNCLVCFQFFPSAVNDVTVSIPGHAPITFPKDHTYYPVTLLREKVSLTLTVGAHSQTQNLDLRDRPYYPYKFPVENAVTASDPLPTAEDKLRALRDYKQFVTVACQHGAPLDKIAFPALTSLAQHAPHVDLKPFLGIYVANAEPGDVYTQAAKHLIDSEPIPLTPEGQQIAAILNQFSTSGHDLLAQYNIARAQLAITEPDRAAAIFANSGEDLQGQLTFYFKRAVTDAVLASHPRSYYPDINRLHHLLTLKQNAELGDFDRRFVNEIYVKARPDLNRFQWNFRDYDGSLDKTVLTSYGKIDKEFSSFNTQK
jgi:hypothetical protein